MIVVAGGTSSRFGGDKMMTPIAGLPLVMHTVAAVSRNVDHCVLVCREDQIESLPSGREGLTVVAGGPTRTGSELAGLDALDDEMDLVGIHDGARPLIAAALIDRLFSAAGKSGGAVPVLEPPGPLVRRVDLDLIRGAMTAQTPQVFRARPLVEAYRRARAEGFQGHDTADVVQTFGDLDIAAVAGDPGNLKVTYPTDLEAVRFVLEASRNGPR
jgi:2-C-methyl-D-erythritol 4-phosphate cytidylyltransferase